MYIIELPKVKKILAKEEKHIENEKLVSWLQFIINPNNVEVKDMEDNKELEEAVEVLEEISSDEEEKFLAEQRLEFHLMRTSLESVGEMRKSKEIAKKMLEANEPFEKIIEFTGLTKEEIEELEK